MTILVKHKTNLKMYIKPISIYIFRKGHKVFKQPISVLFWYYLMYYLNYSKLMDIL